jgi:hypothetical protein
MVKKSVAEKQEKLGYFGIYNKPLINDLTDAEIEELVNYIDDLDVSINILSSDKIGVYNGSILYAENEFFNFQNGRVLIAR